MDFTQFFRQFFNILFACMLFGVLQSWTSDLVINIAVLSDDGNESIGETSCNTPVNIEMCVYGRAGGKIIGNVTWFHLDTPFELLMKARAISGDSFNVFVIDSHRQIYHALKSQLGSERTHVVHWPTREIFEYGIPKNILLQDCICDVHFGDLSEVNNCTVLNDETTGEKYSRNFVVASLISEIHTDSLFVIFQNDKRSRLEFDVSELDQFNQKVIVYDTQALQTDEQITEMLSDATILMKGDAVQFLLLSDEPCVERILRTANKFDKHMGYQTALHQLSRWLVFADESLKEVTREATKGLDNVAFVTLISEEQRISCPRQVLSNIFRSALYQVGCSEAILLSNEKATSIFGNTLKVYKESIQKHRMEYKVETLLWKPNNQRVFESVGSVTGYGDKKLKAKELFPNVNYGFNNRTFLVASLEWPPFSYRRERNGIIEFEGYCIEMLKELSGVLNFSFSFTEPEDGQWGMPVQNGTWTGLVGLLHRREVDMVMAPLSMDARRESAIDFSHPYYYEYTTGLMRKPDPMKTKWRTIIDPFTWQVHVTILSILPVSTVIFYALERANPYNVEADGNSEKKRRKSQTLYDTAWHMLGLTVYQGNVNLPGTLAGRTMLSFCWLYSIIMVALYSGNLIAFLTVTKDNPPFNTIDSLVGQDTYKWGTLNGTIWMTLFKYSKVDSLKAVWNGIERFAKDDVSVVGGNNTAHIEKVLRGDYVYIADQTQFEMLTYTDCNLLLLEEKFYPNNYAVALQNNSPYKDIFSERVMTITESGLPAIWKQKWWPKNTFCNSKMITQSKKIDVIDIQSAFYLLLIGIFCALLSLSLEICLNKRRRKLQGDERKKSRY